MERLKYSPELFDKLRLTENGQLKRATIVLFAKEPDKFFPNTSVKIGRFGKDDADLIFQENEEGCLIVILQSILNQLQHKFLVREISFEGLKRIERSAYPVEALREAILNACVHRNYMGAPTQIRVYDDKIIFWNEGALPEGLSVEALKGFHASQPRNVLVADVCFKGGYIDSWGRGIQKIFSACKIAGLPEPEIKEFQNGLLVTLFKNHLAPERLTKLGLNERQLKAVEYVKENGRITNKDYQKLNLISKPTATRDLSQLVEDYKLFRNKGKGAGSFYELIGS